MCQSLNILGTTFTENDRMDREVEIIYNKVSEVIGQLSQILQHNTVHTKTNKKKKKTSYTKHTYSNVALSMSNMDTYT
jgi:hypothetical protein